MFEHHTSGAVFHNLKNYTHRNHDRCDQWKILQNKRDIPQSFRNSMVVGDDLCIGFQRRGRGDHYRGSASIHRRLGQGGHLCKPRRGHTDDHRHTRTANHPTSDGLRFVGREFTRLSHHAKDSQASSPLFKVEIRHPIKTAQIERTIVGKRGHRNCKNAARGFIQHLLFPCFCCSPKQSATKPSPQLPDKVQPPANPKHPPKLRGTLPYPHSP